MAPSGGRSSGCGCAVAAGVALLLLAAFIGLAFWFLHSSSARPPTPPPPTEKAGPVATPRPASTATPSPADTTASPTSLPQGWEYYEVGGFKVGSPIPLEVDSETEDIGTGAQDGLLIIVTKRNDSGTTTVEAAKAYLTGLLREALEGYKENAPKLKIISETSLDSGVVTVNGVEYPAAEFRVTLEADGKTFERRRVLIKAGPTIYSMLIDRESDSPFPREVVEDLLKYSDPIVESGPLPTGPVSPLPKGWRTYTLGDLRVFSPMPLKDDGSDSAGTKFMRGVMFQHMLSVTVAPLRPKETPESYARDSLGYIKKYVKVSREETRFVNFAGYPGVEITAWGEFKDKPVTIRLCASADQKQIYQVMVQVDDDAKDGRKTALEIIARAEVVEAENRWQTFEIDGLRVDAPFALVEERKNSVAAMTGNNAELTIAASIGPGSKIKDLPLYSESLMRATASAYGKLIGVKTAPSTLAGHQSLRTVASATNGKDDFVLILQSVMLGGHLYQVLVTYDKDPPKLADLGERVFASVQIPSGSPAAPQPASDEWEKYQLRKMSFSAPPGLKVRSSDDLDEVVGNVGGLAVFARANPHSAKDQASIAHFSETTMRAIGVAMDLKLASIQTQTVRSAGGPATMTMAELGVGSKAEIHILHMFQRDGLLYGLGFSYPKGDKKKRATVDRILASVSYADGPPPPAASRPPAPSGVMPDGGPLPPVEAWPVTRIGGLQITAPMKLNESKTGEKAIKAVIGSAKAFSINGHVYDGVGKVDLAGFNEKIIRRIFSEKQDFIKELKHTPITMAGASGDRMVVKLRPGKFDYVIDIIAVRDAGHIYQILVGYDPSVPGLSDMARQIFEQAVIDP